MLILYLFIDIFCRQFIINFFTLECTRMRNGPMFTMDRAWMHNGPLFTMDFFTLGCAWMHN